MSIDKATGMAREGSLYPSVILHGGEDESRRRWASELGRALLCERQPEDRPCGECSHCRRISAAADNEGFHPDFHLLDRDQKTVTSIDATRRFLQSAQMAPYEARGQVFVITAAETLGAEAADTLLKILEEPPPRTPRHFLLLAPSNRELSSTLRIRSMALYLGGGEPRDEDGSDVLAGELTSVIEGFVASGATVQLMAAAKLLEGVGGWKDLRASEPWGTAALAVVRSAGAPQHAPPVRRALLDLAAALLEARSQRLRGITPQRILEGLTIRHLEPLAPAVTGTVAGR
jgi:hypothetical protein